MTAIEYIAGMEHGVIPFLGSGKQGKSCALHTVADICFHDRPKVLLEPSDDIDISVFRGYGKVSSLDDIPVGSVAVIEDVARTFTSRGSASKALLQEFVGVISHKDIVIMMSVQSMADVDVAFLRSQNVVYCHKFMHPSDIGFERPELKSQQTFANLRISEAAKDHPDIDFRAFAYFPKFDEIVALPIVPWWSYRCSHYLREVDLCLKK